MSLPKEVSKTVKKRSRLVFSAIDSGKDPTLIRQHKLRTATFKKLYYYWRPHGNPLRRKHTPEEVRAFLEVRRDSLGRLRIFELESFPEEVTRAWNNLQAESVDNLIYVTDVID